MGLIIVIGTSPLPRPTTHKILALGGRAGERAEAPKVPAMRSIVGMALEGGAASKDPTWD